MLRPLFQTTDPASQPFVVSGSGTLGWDQVAANITEPGDEALVLHTGYFADSFADCFETYGVKATQLKAPIGDRPQLPEIEEALKAKKYKVITVTHTDTSTGVLSQLEDLAKTVKKVSPETLIVVDGVCSVGCEEIKFDDWGLDVVMTASQKAIGCPPASQFSWSVVERWKLSRTANHLLAPTSAAGRIGYPSCKTTKLRSHRISPRLRHSSFTRSTPRSRRLWLNLLPSASHGIRSEPTREEGCGRNGSYATRHERGESSQRYDGYLAP